MGECRGRAVTAGRTLLDSGMSMNTPVAPAGVAHAAPSAQDPALCRGWPLGDFQEFTPRPGAVPPARRRARLLVRAWGLSPLSDDVAQVVAELVANAVAACAAPAGPGPVRVWVLADRHSVLALVADPSPQPPRPAHADTSAEHGRGLTLVAGLSARWGWYPTPETGGKTVWALITAGTVPSPDP
jgi:anti-sigma regulatory factor (Ser/Thr protein kinase)